MTERYFSMLKKDAQEAFRIYTRFIEECGKMDMFLSLCKVRVM